MEDKLLPKVVEVLKFHEVDVSLYEDKGKILITAEEIGQILELIEPRRAVNKIYNRRKSEIEPFSTVTNLGTVDGKVRETRLFTEQGAYLIAMFARTKKAKEVRAWLAGLPERIREIQNRQYMALVKYSDDMNSKYEDLKKLTMGIHEKMMEFEKGGLLSIQGFRDYFEDLVVDLADESQTFSKFIDARCVIKEGQGIISRPNKVYNEYKQFCYDNFSLPLNNKMFNRAIRLMNRKGYRILLSADVTEGGGK